MSRFNLRDVSERLTRSRTTESVISEFLRSLEGLRADWRASLAFYEVSRDALVDVYEVDRGRLIRRNIVVPVDRLPHRLVKKLFQANAFFNETDRASLFSKAGSTSVYEADPREASELLPLTVLAEWQSCVCLPLGYQDDLIALLVLVSPKKNAFGGRALAEVVPLKSIATVALAQHLYRNARQRSSQEDESAERMRKEMELLTEHSIQLDQEGRSRAEQIESLVHQIELLDRDSSGYKQELEKVKSAVTAMERNSEAATEHLEQAFDRLQATQWTLEALESTTKILQDVFHLLAGDQDPAFLPETMMEWFCDRFAIERCSLLVPDQSGEALVMAASRGIDLAIAGQVHVRIGQGVAGWVARHRKPLYVRVRADAQSIPRSPDGTYNSDSFIVVPLVHNGRLHGVLSLSNRVDGEGFSEADLDRALLAASAFAVTFGAFQTARRSAAWV